MSRGSQEQRAELLAELAQELRQLNGLSASFFRAAAARMGMTDTDMQVIDSLAVMGPRTAGQLAELTGLTTGAITGMLNRLEEAGFVSRARDPADGRRVIVRLAPGKDTMREINALFDAAAKSRDELVSHYDDEQISFLLEFVKRSNALSRQEIIRLREAPEDKERVFSAPLGNLTSGQLVASGVSRLIVRADNGMDELYQARFQGPAPDMKLKDGVAILRYPRRLWMLSGGLHGAAEVTLNAGIPWRITIKGGASEIIGELGGLNLAGLEVKGGMSLIHLKLPAPSGVVPIHISGGASEIIVQRPAGVAARARLIGWVSTFIFDDETFSSMGNDARLQSPGYERAASGYDIEVASSASMITITTE